MNNPIERLPHKAPALLIDSVVESNSDGATCTIAHTLHPTIAPAGVLPTAMGLEIIAQAAAIWLIVENPGTTSKGMLVQCKDFVMNVDMLNVEDRLRVTVQPGHRSDATSLHQFTGWINETSGRILCSATLLLMIKMESDKR